MSSYSVYFISRGQQFEQQTNVCLYEFEMQVLYLCNIMHGINRYQEFSHWMDFGSASLIIAAAWIPLDLILST